MLDACDFADVLYVVSHISESDLGRWMSRLPTLQCGRRALRLADVKSGKRWSVVTCLLRCQIRRQVRVTPYPHEPAGWIVQNTGPEVAMFSSDYPHVEGGRHPMRRFEASLAECSDGERRAFFRDNFVDLMGPRLPAQLRS